VIDCCDGYYNLGQLPIEVIYRYISFLIGKLHTHLVSIKPMILHFTLLLQGEEVPFELKLIGTY
jgi:hypothetical protein